MCYADVISSSGTQCEGEGEGPEGEGDGEGKKRGKGRPGHLTTPNHFQKAKLNPLCDWPHYNLIIMRPIRSVGAVELDLSKITSKQVDPTHWNKRAVMLGLTRAM